MSKTMLLGSLAIIIAIVTTLSAYLYFAQGKIIFFPTPELFAQPGDIGLDAEDLHIEVATGQSIHVWYFEPGRVLASDRSDRWVLFCHGNGGNMSHRLETAQMLVELGCHVLMFDYRGYGQSDGDPTELNCYEDAQACYDWLRNSRGARAEQLFVFGRSLGGAIAVDLASKVECGGLIVESSFTSAAAMGRLMFPYLPVKWLVRYHFDSAGKIPGVHCPVLVTHSSEDDLVPCEMGQQLYDLAPEPRDIYLFSGSHNSLDHLRQSGYRKALGQFLFGGESGS